MASAVPFSCAHIAATENSSEPLSAKILNPEDIHAYNCDEATKKKLWQHLNPPEDFRHMVKISEHCLAIFTEPSTSNPGFVMLKWMEMENCNALTRIATENLVVASKSSLRVFACTFMFCSVY